MIQLKVKKLYCTSSTLLKNKYLQIMDDKMKLEDLCAHCFDTLLASLQDKKQDIPIFPGHFKGVIFTVNFRKASLYS